MIWSGKIWRSTAIAACLAIAAAVFGWPGPDHDLRSAIAIHDFGHVIAFGVVTLLLAVALNGQPGATVNGRFRTIWLSAVLALFLGVSVELAQAVTGRNGDVWDAVRDAGGAASIALVLSALRHKIPSVVCAALSGAALLILAALAYPAIAALHDEARARMQFPMLASFETEGELSRFRFTEGITPRLVMITSGNVLPVSGMQLQLPSGRYPGFELRYFPRDWRGMRALRLLIINPSPDPMDLTVRIDDVSYRQRLDDRYNRSFSLAPGPNRIEIPLANLAFSPRHRRFDLSRVFALLVYAVDIKNSRNIIVGPITLVG